MSETSVQDPPPLGGSSDSGHTLASRPPQPAPDASASKRVCFYRSGDYTFSGHRMIITSRTFKTFDALLDALSKKVPLPFGVRTITTPRGTHLVKALDDLQDGGAYVCSDQKRVKPLNLDEVSRRQVPWNATRAISAERRRRQALRLGQAGRGNDVAGRPLKVMDRVAVRTPKKLVVIKNKDPTVKRTIVLQRRTAPSFDALLDYLSQILQFPVLKLYSTDGRRVEGLSALILCSGVVVAAGKEPFKLGSFNFQRSGQAAQIMYVENVEPSAQQPRFQRNKSRASGRGSKNFSLSSERYIVNQIRKSQNGSVSDRPDRGDGFTRTEARRDRTPTELCQNERRDMEQYTCIIPHDDDIEKSFRVNQDGSMTVEMKVHLTIKEEEMLHWTTTLSRSSLSRKKACASESGHDSPDSNNTVAKDSPSVQEEEAKEENWKESGGKGVGFASERVHEGYTSSSLGKKANTSFKRTPTPGPRRVDKKASVESVKMVTETGFQESMLGRYSYVERTSDGETTEGYCVVTHSSSSSSKPVPKPRKTASSGGRKKAASVRSSEAAEVLQIDNDGMEVTETVMHIYETQGCYDNYLANEEYSADGASLHESEGKPSLRPSSSNNDCDIDGDWQPPAADSKQGQKDEMLSLSSEPENLSRRDSKDLSSGSRMEARTNSQLMVEGKRNDTPKSLKKKTKLKPVGNAGSTISTGSTEKKASRSTISTKNSKGSSVEKLSNSVSAGQKSLKSEGSSKSDLKTRRAGRIPEKSQSSKSIPQKLPMKDSAVSVSSGNMKTIPSRVGRENGHNIDTPTVRPQMKKNISDFLESKKSSSKPKSMIEYKLSSPKSSLQLSDCSSMASLNPSPSEIHQYVENWLEKVSSDQVPYSEGVGGEDAQAKVVFKLGADSESEETNECLAELSAEPLKNSTSCLSVPLSHEELIPLPGEHSPRGLCVSMPSIRMDPVEHGNKLRSNKSAAVIGQRGTETLSSSNLLNPREKVKPVLRHLCSSIECICRAPASRSTPNLQNSQSVPDFSTQVASVFGSSCKAFLSFLSVMSLRDNLTGPGPRESHQSETTSEAMLMLESLQKISNIEDEEEQRASLTDLQSNASSRLRESWKDFRALRERLESEPLSPRVSETEFALDVVSEGGDAFEDQRLGIDELMEEMNMPDDLRAEIASTIQHVRSFYPAEESTYVETVKHQSESEEEEDVEQFATEDQGGIDEIKPFDVSTGKKNTESGEVQASESERDKTSYHSDDSNTNVREKTPDQEGGGEDEEPEREEDDERTGEGIKNEGDSEGERESVTKSAEKVDEESEEGTSVKLESEERKETEKVQAEEEAGCSDRTQDTDEREGEAEDMEESTGEEGENSEAEEEEGEEEEQLESKQEQIVEETRSDDVEEEDEYLSAEEAEGSTLEIEERVNETDQEEMLEEKEGETDRVDEENEKEGITLSKEEESKIDAEEHGKEEDEEISQVNSGSASENNEERGEEGRQENTGNKSENDEENEEQGEEEEEQEAQNDHPLTSENSSEADDCEIGRGGEVLENIRTSPELGEEEEVTAEPQVEEDLTSEHSEQETERDAEGEDDPNSSLMPLDDMRDEGLNSEDLPSSAENESRADEAKKTIIDEEVTQHAAESPSKSSSEGRCADDKGADTIHETDEGGEEQEKSGGSLSHPVEISQELLDFVNFALQSCSLRFTYDTQGKMRIEPEDAAVVQTKQSMIRTRRKDSSYGLKNLPSPVTSDLSDYRPETSESGGYQSQGSVDIASESGEDGAKKSLGCTNSGGVQKAEVERAESKMSASSSLKAFSSPGSFSSSESATKALREDLSYFSAASSLKEDGEVNIPNTERARTSYDKDSPEGVLIDQGRWLLKENHLIRKSPPVSMGMYGNLDSTSIDSAQENSLTEGSPPHSVTQPNPLTVISSSDLEEMAKPDALKCKYFNMPHGSDSDPFLDDASIRSGKLDAGTVKGRGFRVSPKVDTSKTWGNRNGSLSSFASVEFKIPDRKVHPEGESSAAAQAGRTSGGQQGALQAQDSLDSLHLRCGQYCPIL